MSQNAAFSLPPDARARSLRTPRGVFAAVESPVPDGVEPRGVVLMVPGFTGSKEDFTLLHGPLTARGYHTVAVDGRGQYESPGPREDEAAYARRELALDVHAQVAALEEPRTHLLGHSLGGQIARAAVLVDHSPFRSLTLMSSGPARISAAQRERVALLSDALTTMPMERIWEAMRAMGPVEAVGGPPAGPSDQEGLRRRWLGTSPAQLRATGRQLCTEPDRVAELAAVPLPFHVLSGAHDDAWPVPLLDDMATRLGALRTVVADADHSPNTDRPLATAEALAGFWDGVPY
ncbi:MULTISPECIES: alpha/beta fold hydrolase [unclassified Streptomyces]|uniref:alpha/beta fold hydrolase n=1 Tax=unclassified Streptomyces TaxID=2593676 RepID=UPI001905A61D|nr:alpha/beta hydrolase [Streptomyces sp. HSG2]